MDKSVNTLTPAYSQVFDLLENDNFQTFTVGEFYCDRDAVPVKNKVNVVLRIDVDNGLHLSEELARELRNRSLVATFYFLTDEDLHYRIWDSGIPKIISRLGHEVGIHSDHLYIQSIKGVDGIELLKNDIKKLKKQAQTEVRGMCAHGHINIEKIGLRNRDLILNIKPEDLGLEYHDGKYSKYTDNTSLFWAPITDYRISDYLGVQNAWGWNINPDYPLDILKEAKPGQIVHIGIHPLNAFYYWENWEVKYGEKKISKINKISMTYKKTILFIKPYLNKLTLANFKDLIVRLFLWSISYFLSRIIGRFINLFTKSSNRKTDWVSGRERIVELGTEHWKNILQKFDLYREYDVAVEIGSGNGQWLLALAENCKTVYGFEPNDDVRNWSIDYLKKYPEFEKKILIKKASAEEIPIDNDSVDFVLCVGVFMFTQQDKAISEISRILKPGGKILLTVNGLGYFYMYIYEGIKYGDYNKTHYGLKGVLSTIMKWVFGSNLPYPKAVKVNEMKNMFTRNEIKMDDVRLWLPEDDYPLENFGKATNYAFVGEKVSKKK